jgi:MFS family permease
MPSPPPQIDPPQAPTSSLSAALAPLQEPVFRMLWLTWLTANACLWMNDVAAAWMMTSLTSTPIWVALVATASTLPVFLLGLPSGALADILDRKRFFLMTQLWVALVAIVLSATVFAGVITPAILLALTFANGIGLALRWPVYAAIVPELVARDKLPAALALNGIAMNASRIVGPLIAGALIASFGSAYVFLLNAVLSLLAAVAISRWQRKVQAPPLGPEKLLGAIRVGLQFAGQSRHLKGVLVLISLFFFHSTALLALLPLVARGLQGGGAGTYTLLLAAMGSGAIAAALYMPRLRQIWSRDGLVARSATLQSVAMLVVAFAPNAWIAVPAMFALGTAWITTANALSVSLQMGLPDWVRARCMSMYQMAIMGASALGAATWGQVATMSTVQVSVCVGAVSGFATMMLAIRRMKDYRIEEDLTPSDTFRVPVAVSVPETGHIVTTVEYFIDPARSSEFRELMLLSRSSRLRHGALHWELLRDVSTPGRFVEQITDASWTEHLRRFERVTASDAALRDRKLAFHIGEHPVVISRAVLESTIRA